MVRIRNNKADDWQADRGFTAWIYLPWEVDVFATAVYSRDHTTGGASVTAEISVLLLEDNRPTLERFRRAIEAAPEIVRCDACETVLQARTSLDATEPKLIITDLRLPDGSGLDFIRYARRKCPEVEVMVISALGDERTVVSAIEAGATGYLLKDAQSIDIVSALRQLLGGGSPISSSVARHILTNFRHTHVGGRQHARRLLTERELEVLSCIARGYTYREAAEILAISPNTLPTHIKNIYRKLEVNSRGEAVYEAVQRGLLDL